VGIHRFILFCFSALFVYVLFRELWITLADSSASHGHEHEGEHRGQRHASDNCHPPRFVQNVFWFLKVHISFLTFSPDYKCGLDKGCPGQMIVEIGLMPLQAGRRTSLCCSAYD
jgi:hypothetical protein